MKLYTYLFLCLIVFTQCNTNNKSVNINVEIDDIDSLEIMSYKNVIYNSSSKYSLKGDILSLNVISPQFFQIKIANEDLLTIFLKPGDDFILKKDSKQYIYDGTGKYLNTAIRELNNIYVQNYDYELSLSEASYKIYRDSLNIRSEFINISNLNKDEISILENEKKSLNLLSKLNRLFFKKYIFQDDMTDSCISETDLLKDIFSLHHYLKLGSPKYQGIIGGFLPEYIKRAKLNLNLDELPNRIIEFLEAKNIIDILRDSIENTKDLERNFYKKFPKSVYKREIEEAKLINRNIRKGEYAKEINVNDLNGNFISLLKDKKSIKIIKVWATWCRPCIKEIPHFNDLKEKYEDVDFYTISIDEDIEKWKNFNLLNKDNYYLIPRSSNNSFFKDYKIEGIGRYIVIDENNEIIEPYAKIERLETILREKI